MADGTIKSLNQAWYDFMVRLGIYGPSRVADSATLLNAIDTKIGVSSKKYPPIKLP